MIEPGDLETRKPNDGESLYGFIAGVAAENDLVRVALIAAADRTYGHRQQLWTAGEAELQPVADLLEVDVRELVDRTLQAVPGDPARWGFFGTTVAKNDVRTRERFFSPAALKSQPFHRAIWQLRIPFDVATGEVLVAKCPLCGKTQRWRHTAGIDCCDGCGDPLDQPVDTIDETILPDVKLAVGLTHTDAAKRAASLALLPDDVSGLGAATAYELLLRLVPVVHPGCTWVTADRIWRNDPHHIAEGMHRAWQILKGWPHAMTDKFNRDLATSETRHSDGNGGRTVRFLKLRKQHHIPKPLRDVLQHLHDAVSLSGPHGERLRATTMPLKEVSRRIGLGTAQIVALRRGGAFRTIGVIRQRSLVPMFDRAEIEQLVRDIAQRRDLDRANRLLGLPYYAAEQLCALGRLPLLEHPFFEGRYSQLQTTSDAFRTLISLIESRSTAIDGPSIPIIDGMKMVGGRLKPWDAVIEAMIAEKLPFSLSDGPEAVFERVRVRRLDLIPHLAAPITRGDVMTSLTARMTLSRQNSSLMTKLDAAEVLNLGSNQGTKVLRAFPTTPKAVVPIDHVLSLAGKYVTNTEIAARLSTTTHVVRSVALGRRIRQACEAGYDRTRESELIGAVLERLANAA